MKKPILDSLKDARDFSTLAACILNICESYGPLHSFRFIHNKRAGRVACFVELDSLKQQQSMALDLGATICVGQVCLEIPVRPDIAGNREHPIESGQNKVGPLLSRRGAAPAGAAGESMNRDCVSHSV